MGITNRFDFLSYCVVPPNGMRYPRVGGTRQRHFAGTNLKPLKQPENAASPTRRVHAVLGRLYFGRHL
jgi:hypothetical protein